MISAISNVNTLSALFALQRTQASMNTVLQRLSTGRRINSGRDDPAGLIASERLASEIRSLEVQNRASARADSNAAIAEGNAAELSTMFSDLNGLVLASANQAGMSDAEIAANQMQIDNTVASIQRFHGNSVSSLDGINMPNGGNAAVTALYDNALAAAVSVRSGGANDLASGNFAAAQTAISAASTDVASARGRIGGYQKDVIGPQIRSNQVAIENLTASRSRIVDTDFAEEMSNFVRNKILLTAGFKTLKIAQQQTKSVLDLLA